MIINDLLTVDHCTVCEGTGKVPDKETWTLDRGTAFERTCSCDVITECPQCGGSGIIPCTELAAMHV